jgi:rhodanese-related sulfurtransferase
MAGISRETLAALRASGRRIHVFDVRTAEEFAEGTVDGAEHLSRDRFEEVARTLGPEAYVVTVCNHGGSNCQGAAAALVALGMDARHLIGGVKGPKEGH